MKKNNKVNVNLSSVFYDKVFEPKRREIQKQLGLNNLSQIEFSSLIKDIKINVNFNLRKFNKNKRFKL